MKQIVFILSILILLTLSACTLRAPGGEPPTAAVLETEMVEETTPVEPDLPTSTTLPSATDTAQPTAVPPTAAPPTETTEPTQALESAEGQPTATQAAPTATSTPAPTIDTTTIYGEPTYENPMTVAVYWEWAQAETNKLPNNQNLRLQFKDGDLYVTGKKLNFSTWWFSGHYLGDAYIEMTYDTENCSGKDAYGMIFRGPPHGAGISYGYVVSFTCNGEFTVFRLDDPSPWDVEELVEVQKNSAINTGSNVENVIGVRTEGDQFTIFANGTQIAEFEDDHFLKGRVGVFVRSARPDRYTYRVKNFAIWSLGEED
jgi:hypothetical protein